MDRKRKKNPPLIPSLKVKSNKRPKHNKGKKNMKSNLLHLQNKNKKKSCTILKLIIEEPLYVIPVVLPKREEYKPSTTFYYHSKTNDCIIAVTTTKTTTTTTTTTTAKQYKDTNTTGRKRNVWVGNACPTSSLISVSSEGTRGQEGEREREGGRDGGREVKADGKRGGKEDDPSH